MTADELIYALKQLPPAKRELHVTFYFEELDRPGYNPFRPIIGITEFKKLPRAKDRCQNFIPNSITLDV